VLPGFVRWAKWLESQSDDFLAERVRLPAGMTPGSKTRFEMLLSTKEHEMHHRSQTNADRADARHRAAPDAPDAGAYGGGVHQFDSLGSDSLGLPD
jgi:hypothetical protein